MLAMSTLPFTPTLITNPVLQCHIRRYNEIIPFALLSIELHPPANSTLLLDSTLVDTYNKYNIMARCLKF
jgi:hypothetical protein